MPTITMELTDHQFDQYQRDGYVATDVIFGEDELHGLRESFEQSWRESVHAAEKHGDALHIQMARYRPFIAHLHQRYDACRRVFQHPAVCAIARQLIGADVDMTYDQAVIKPPRSPDATIQNHFNWHQDAYYPTHSKFNASKWNHDKLLNLSNGFMGWIAVTRATVDNGCLWSVPGMHRHGLLPHQWNDAQKEWVAQFDTSRKAPLELEPGQMLIFTPLTPHYSGPNVTADQTRMAYQFGLATPGTCSLPEVLPVMRAGSAK